MEQQIDVSVSLSPPFLPVSKINLKKILKTLCQSNYNLLSNSSLNILLEKDRKIGSSYTLVSNQGF